MWSAVNVLPNSPKASYVTKVEIFQLNLSSINVKVAWKFRSPGSTTIWDPLIRLLGKGVLKQEVTGIQVTTFDGFDNFRNI